MNKKLGIIFAISRVAGELCYETVKKLIDDSDEILVFANTQSQDFTKAKMICDINEKKQYIAELLFNGVSALAEKGADLIIIAANSVHIAFQELTQKVEQAYPNVQILSIVEEVVAASRSYNSICLLGSGATIVSRLYQDKLEREDISIINLMPQEQKWVDDIIGGSFTRESLPVEYSEGISKLVQRLQAVNCEAVILACTELPSLLEPNIFENLIVIDSNKILALAASKRLREIGFA